LRAQLQADEAEGAARLAGAVVADLDGFAAGEKLRRFHAIDEGGELELEFAVGAEHAAISGIGAGGGDDDGADGRIAIDIDTGIDLERAVDGDDNIVGAAAGNGERGSWGVVDVIAADRRGDATDGAGDDGAVCEDKERWFAGAAAAAAADFEGQLPAGAGAGALGAVDLDFDTGGAGDLADRGEDPALPFTEVGGGSFESDFGGFGGGGFGHGISLE